MNDISQAMAQAAMLDEDGLQEAEIVWPIRTTFSTHSAKDDNYMQGEKLGLKGQALQDFRYTGLEVIFDVLVDKNGNVTATHVNGVALEKPVSL